MAKAPTKAQKKKWELILALGCSVEGAFHAGRMTIHHCFTKMGCEKDHDEVIGLCWEHHLGANGIDGKRMGKRTWESMFGTEHEHREKTERKLNGIYC